MFSKKTCQRCGKKTSKGNSFCPSCGFALGKINNQQDFGMLGKNDSFNELNPFANSPFQGISGSFMNKMISNTMKMLEKEMEKEMRSNSKNPNINNNPNNLPRTKIRLMINGKEVKLNEGIEKESSKKDKPKQTHFKFKNFSEEQIKKFSKLHKKQPKTELKRIADKIIYEIEIPGVESVEDVSITNLESSIELKALGKEKAYSKSIPINLPIVGYDFSEGLLVLEFQGN